jgi:protein-S-isoprenylcysteine O-methyltransferase Ste14
MSFFIKLYVPVFMTIYFVVALFLKSFLQYKRTGVNPLTFGRRQESAHDYIGFWFKIVLALVFIHGFLNSFVLLSQISFLNNFLIQVIGIVLTVVSLGFTTYAQNAMGNSWRIGIDEDEETQLVTKGPFAYVRNPIFLGMIVTLFGILFLIPTYIMLFLLILSYILINIQTRLEEEHLLKIHGNHYLDYKKSTGRFLPKS